MSCSCGIHPTILLTPEALIKLKNHRQSAPNATHIVTSQRLSGNKTQEMLTWKNKRKAYVVKPEWVRDCVAAGKRIGEGKYLVERPGLETGHGTAAAGKM
jgi:hypothetical protein